MRVFSIGNPRLIGAEFQNVCDTFAGMAVTVRIARLAHLVVLVFVLKQPFEGIVNNLKDNPNPTIREACLSALNYVGRPEDKEVLKTLYDISAKHDSNPAVQTSAKDYLSKLPA